MELDSSLQLFIVDGGIGIYLLKMFVHVLNKTNELVDKISTLIAITYEATHNPGMTTSINVKNN